MIFSYSIPQALLVLKIKCIFYAAKVHFFYEKGHNKDNLSEQTNATKTNNLTDTHNISHTKQGFTKSPAETYAKNLAFFRRSMIMDMCDDICGYITLFDFNGVI